MSSGSVDVFYIDPAWLYRNIKTGGSHKSGAAQKYPTMPTSAIAMLPIKELASPKGSVCFLWATVPLGAEPYHVMHAWGFEYKTEWFWHKVGKKGTGYWTRGAVEKLLIGVRGKVPAWRSSLDNWIETSDPSEVEIVTSKPEGHSQKPEAVVRRIEELTMGAGRRVELFASSHSAEVAARAPAMNVGTPWECYGLDLGHDFKDPAFWAGLLGEPAPQSLPLPEADLVPTLGDA